ncbi:MAG: iron-containing alcohol dehydrogenase family protein [Candidatus Metalachnospira sp.]|nr:iron-containing alcohol dehydrogenase family protein [Candidatus Metalachnospira sp.]
MEGYHIFIPNYTIGSDCYKEIPWVARNYGKKAVVIGGKTAMTKAKDALLNGIAGSDLTITDYVWYGGQATYENAEEIAAMECVKNADIIFAVGGGRVMDTCKVIKEKLDKPMFTFPTIGSNCAATTSIAVIYHPDGSVNNYFYSKTPAEHIFINTKIIAESPEKLFWAGIGDCISKELEAELSIRGHKAAHTALMGNYLSKICIDPLIEYGKKAYEDCKKSIDSFELEQVTLDIIVSTGMVSNFMTTENDYYYNSSLAHGFYNGTSVIPNCIHDHLHGEIVSFGSLVLLTYDKNYDECDRIMAFHKEMGLPVCMEDIDLTEADLQAVAERASITKEWTCVPYEVTKEKFIAAIKECSERGKRFK